MSITNIYEVRNLEAVVRGRGLSEVVDGISGRAYVKHDGATVNPPDGAPMQFSDAPTAWRWIAA